MGVWLGEGSLRGGVWGRGARRITGIPRSKEGTSRERRWCSREMLSRRQDERKKVHGVSIH